MTDSGLYGGYETVYNFSLTQSEIYDYGFNDTVVTVEEYFVSQDSAISTDANATVLGIYVRFIAFSF